MTPEFPWIEDQGKRLVPLAVPFTSIATRAGR
jgi:hypothetical protein